MKQTSRIFTSVVLAGLLSACGSTSNDVSGVSSEASNTPNGSSLKERVNLLAFANPGFEMPLETSAVVVRNDPRQVNLAEFGIMPEAAKDGKGGLAVSLEKGGMKLKYPIAELAPKIDKDKAYRFEIDVEVIKSEAMLWTMTGSNKWTNKKINSNSSWQSVGIDIPGQYLRAGDPLIFHLDNVNGKDTAVLLVDNVRLYQVD